MNKLGRRKESAKTQDLRQRRRRPDFSPIGTPVREKETVDVFRLHGLPAPVFNYKLNPLYPAVLHIAWPDKKVYIEVVKSTDSNSVRMKSQNMAVAMGWRPLVLSPGMVRDRATCALVRGLMKDA